MIEEVALFFNNSIRDEFFYFRKCFKVFLMEFQSLLIQRIITEILNFVCSFSSFIDELKFFSLSLVKSSPLSPPPPPRLHPSFHAPLFIDFIRLFCTFFNSFVHWIVFVAFAFSPFLFSLCFRVFLTLCFPLFFIAILISFFLFLIFGKFSLLAESFFFCFILEFDFRS